MLVYEKKVNGETRLFGTEANIPAENDAQLKYKDIDGDVLTIITNDQYVDNGAGGIIRKSDDKFMGVFIGDAQKAIIPNGWEPEAKQVKSLTIKTAPTKVVYNSGDVLDLTGLVLKAKYKDGDVAEVTTGFTSVPANGETLTALTQSVEITYGGKTCTQDITVRPALIPSTEQVELNVQEGSSADVVIVNADTLTSATSSLGYVTTAIDVESATVTVTYATGAATSTDTVDVMDNTGRHCAFRVHLNAV